MMLDSIIQDEIQSLEKLLIDLDCSLIDLELNYLYLEKENNRDFYLYTIGFKINDTLYYISKNNKGIYSFYDSTSEIAQVESNNLSFIIKTVLKEKVLHKLFRDISSTETNINKIMDNIQKELKEYKLVVLYGQSDDLIEFGGFIYDELDWYDAIGYVALDYKDDTNMSIRILENNQVENDKADIILKLSSKDCKFKFDVIRKSESVKEYSYTLLDNNTFYSDVLVLDFWISKMKRN